MNYSEVKRIYKSIQMISFTEITSPEYAGNTWVRIAEPLRTIEVHLSDDTVLELDITRLEMRFTGKGTDPLRKYAVKRIVELIEKIQERPV